MAHIDTPCPARPPKKETLLRMKDIKVKENLLPSGDRGDFGEENWVEGVDDTSRTLSFASNTVTMTTENPAKAHQQPSPSTLSPIAAVAASFHTTKDKSRYFWSPSVASGSSGSPAADFTPSPGFQVQRSAQRSAPSPAQQAVPPWQVLPRKKEVLSSPAINMSPVSTGYVTTPTSSVMKDLYTHVGKSDTQANPESCSCNRSPKLILCKSCGEMCEGRVRQMCQAHPKQIFLMDVVCCSSCKSKNLKEICSAKPSANT